MAISVLRCPVGSRTAATIARAWDLRGRDDVCLDTDIWKVTSPGSRIAVLSEADPRITVHLTHRTREMGPVTERYVSFDRATATWRLEREPPFIARALEAGTLSEEEVAQWRSSCPGE